MALDIMVYVIKIALEEMVSVKTTFLAKLSVAPLKQKPPIRWNSLQWFKRMW